MITSSAIPATTPSRNTWSTLQADPRKGVGTISSAVSPVSCSPVNDTSARPRLTSTAVGEDHSWQESAREAAPPGRKPVDNKLKQEAEAAERQHAEEAL